MTDESVIDSDELDEIEAESAIDEPEKAETAEQTARAVWEELSKQADETDATAKVVGEDLSKLAADKPDDISEAARKLAGQRKAKKRQTFVPEGSQAAQSEPVAAEAPKERIDPPASWDVKDKEWFMSQPPEVQRNAAKWFKDAQGHTTKLWQDLNRETNNVREINQVVERHWKDLGLEGRVSKAQALDQLFQYQRRINSDSAGAILEMMQHRKVSLSDLQARMTGQAPAPPQQAQPEQQRNFLTEDQVRQIWRQEQLQAEQQRATQAATAEVYALKQEVQGGRYVYPELHDPQSVNRLQPLITYFGETNPQASWADRYKMAIAQDRVNRGVPSPSPAVPRLSQQESIQAVRQASSSLRSRGGNGAIPRMSEPKPNETARESAEAAYYEIFGNKQH